MDARKPKYGTFVRGRSGRARILSSKNQEQQTEDGWLLTESGIEWIHCNLKVLETFADSPTLKQHRHKILRRLKRIRDHKLFTQYIDSPDRFNPMIGDIADMLRCRVDAEVEVWNDRFDKLGREAKSTEQVDLLDFTDKCKQAYLEQR